MLDNEAELYDAFPPALVGCKEVQYSDTCYFTKSTSTYLVDDPGSALVPKFYGFYVPYEPAVPATSVRGSSYRQPITGEVSPILLIEDCGTEIRAHKQSDRERCESLMTRLHDAGFTQGSYRSRNFLVEDRPSAAEEEVEGEAAERCPHYRIIDFGRGSSKKVLREQYGWKLGLYLFNQHLKEDQSEMKAAWRERTRKERREDSDSCEHNCICGGMLQSD
ncbi:hypothetical protein OH76DRAFT_1354825 [Lentinus brumalis]|uniref:Protein kinase domain-containing protein n=1 Tax=Lentinus brumalis TaxID=2498619 RepID=A0A371D3V2_9APHY|nr:hypothetical protein OH76DRAFT_1354825 [Polyporus brumalis]